MSKFEVTVPLTVEVELSEDGYTQILDCKLDEGWPGFFSEAQDANGVWNPAVEQWGDADQEGLRSSVWFYVRRTLAMGELYNGEPGRP